MQQTQDFSKNILGNLQSILVQLCILQKHWNSILKKKTLKLCLVKDADENLHSEKNVKHDTENTFFSLPIMIDPSK